MASVPEQLKYTKEHEWVREVSTNRYRVGITDYAQVALGDIVYIQLPKIGEQISAGKVCGEVESTKSVSEIYAPLSGEIVLVNDSLDSAPETLNRAPYDQGWIFEVEISSPSEIEGLLSAGQYASLTA
ncbi:MAG: glycine cleavage system protein GcvH [Actinobacteria bacterium]|nr:glycine cleavage system protein GcvH [Actinomycetota bacterium]NBO07187.1 glycine cleavage system protein GcvH [Actinomycetota bacterium]NBP12315.1 glycine cleavage system protein GcvH [Actinomycetota bacterium]NBP22058.1 glycine cleavage system protein GcvH [Actinomycetota bacterium]NBQ00572.1 glycine cleavage system protein GcvH [Actinomycetota bacterium]